MRAPQQLPPTTIESIIANPQSLLNMRHGVFAQVNKAVMNNLVKVDPYIMYGYPNLKTVRSAA